MGRNIIMKLSFKKLLALGLFSFVMTTPVFAIDKN